MVARHTRNGPVTTPGFRVNVRIVCWHCVPWLAFGIHLFCNCVHVSPDVQPEGVVLVPTHFQALVGYGGRDCPTRRVMF